MSFYLRWGQLLVTATTQSRRTFLEAYIFKFLTAANTQVAGWFGRQLGLVSFLASVAEYNGVNYYGYMVAE